MTKAGKKVTEADRLIAWRIRMLLTARGMTLTDLAKAVGVPYRTFQGYIHGESRVPASVILDAARVLDVNISLILTEMAAEIDKNSLRYALINLEAMFPNHFRFSEIDAERAMSIFTAAYESGYARLHNILDAFMPEGHAVGRCIPPDPAEEAGPK